MSVNREVFLLPPLSLCLETVLHGSSFVATKILMMVALPLRSYSVDEALAAVNIKHSVFLVLRN